MPKIQGFFIPVSYTHLDVYKRQTPYKIASYAGANGYYVAGSGSSWSLMTEAALNFGVAGTEIALSESSVTEELNAGHPIICSMKQGDFTTDGHFIRCV